MTQREKKYLRVYVVHRALTVLVGPPLARSFVYGVYTSGERARRRAEKLNASTTEHWRVSGSFNVSAAPMTPRTRNKAIKKATVRRGR